MKNILIGLVLTATMSFASATIVSGSAQTVFFNSHPEGASVKIDGQLKCYTPCSVSLKKNEYENILFEKEGYRSQHVPLTKSYDGVALLSFFWDFSTTDAATGAIYEYNPNNYLVDLKKK